jgi:hypothetical protein
MRRRRLLVTSAAAFGCAGSALACSVLLDWNEFTLGDEVGASDGGTGLADGRDAGDGGNAGDGAGSRDSAAAEPDATPLTPCGTDKLCAPAVPSVPGWQGPYTLFAGAPGAPSQCDPSNSQPAFTGYDGLSAANPTCSCSCSAPAGGACSMPPVTFFSDVCVTTCGSAVPLAGCVASPTACPNFKVGDSTPDGGSCAASATPTPPAVTWAEGAQVCRPPQGAVQGSCTSGELCLSEGSGAFCIMQAGMVTCPPGDYAVSHVYYSGTTDTRACSACTCGPASGASCSFGGGPLGFPYLDPMCATAPTGALVLDSCIVIPTVKAVELKATPMLLDAGSCAPSGGVASGTATPAQPTTLCCTR